MNRVCCRCLVFTALLCGAGPVMADETLNLPRHSLLASETLARSGFQPDSRTEVDLTRFFGGGALEWGNNRFAVPLKQETWYFDSRRTLLVNVLAIEWQHSMNAANSLTLSASHSDRLYSDPEFPGPSAIAGPAFSGTTAALSWRSLLGSESRFSGRLYVGDEEIKTSSTTDRRYYGMHLEGSYGLWRDHAPFASLLWQRGNTDLLDSPGSAAALYRRDNFSRLAAGWNWQVAPSWDVRAEANYRLADDSAETGEFDRTQLYFSTRYGFR